LQIPAPENNDRNHASLNIHKPMSGPDRRPSTQFEFGYRSKNVEISANGNVEKFPGHKVDYGVGVRGLVRF
jgi:hypothetical protein